MDTYVEQYVRACILNRKVIPSIIRKEIYIKLLELIESKKRNFYMYCFRRLYTL